MGKRDTKAAKIAMMGVAPSAPVNERTSVARVAEAAVSEVELMKMRMELGELEARIEDMNGRLARQLGEVNDFEPFLLASSALELVVERLEDPSPLIRKQAEVALSKIKSVQTGMLVSSDSAPFSPVAVTSI